MHKGGGWTSRGPTRPCPSNNKLGSESCLWRWKGLLRQRCAATDSSSWGILSYPFSSAPSIGEGGWSRSTEAGRVRGAPRSRELVVNFREEQRGSLLRGLTAPRQEPLIQTAVRGLLWWRPLQTQLFNRFWEDTEKFGIHPGFGGAGRGQTWGGGVSYRARQLLSIWRCQWHAVIGQLIVTSPERDQIACACRGTLVRLGKKDGRNLSVWRERGTPALRSSARCFFPHRSLEEENGRGRGVVGRALKRKRSASAERRDWCSRSEKNQRQRAWHLHGISPSRKRTRCDRHRRAGGTCTSRSNGAALERRFALLGVCVRFAGWRQRTGPEEGGSAEQIEVAGSSCEACQREWLLGQCRRSRRRWREEIWGSYCETGAYIARWPRPFWRDLAGFGSSAADPLVRFLLTTRTNSRAVSLRDWKGFFPYASLSRRSTSGVSTGNSVFNSFQKSCFFIVHSN